MPWLVYGNRSRPYPLNFIAATGRGGNYPCIGQHHGIRMEQVITSGVMSRPSTWCRDLCLIYYYFD